MQELCETPEDDDSFIIKSVYDVEQVKLTIIHLFFPFLLCNLEIYGIIRIAHGDGKSNGHIWEKRWEKHITYGKLQENEL